MFPRKNSGASLDKGPSNKMMYATLSTMLGVLTTSYNTPSERLYNTPSERLYKEILFLWMNPLHGNITLFQDFNIGTFLMM